MKANGEVSRGPKSFWRFVENQGQFRRGQMSFWRFVEGQGQFGV